jgi:Mce-associated membrane protein
MSPTREALIMPTQTTDRPQKQTTAVDDADTGEHVDDPSDALAPRTDRRAQTDPPAETDHQAETDQPLEAEQQVKRERRRLAINRVIAFGILPGLAMVLALFAGYAKWQEATTRDTRLGGIQAVQAAKDGAVALLGYQFDTVERDLTTASDRLTGTFRETYTSLTHDVVIPGAKQKHISTVANVPAAALVSASGRRAVVLVFVDQTTTIGNDAPTSTASSVRVTLDKVDSRWLISGFDPV